MFVREIRNTDVYEQFKKYYGVTDEEVRDWRSVTNYEIVVHMVDGSIVRFNGQHRTFGYLKKHDRDARGNYSMSDEEYRQAFTEKLQRLVDARGITQKRLSEETGISQVSISSYLNGKKLPDCRNISRLANSLGCSAAELMYFE